MEWQVSVCAARMLCAIAGAACGNDGYAQSRKLAENHGLQQLVQLRHRTNHLSSGGCPEHIMSLMAALGERLLYITLPKMLLHCAPPECILPLMEAIVLLLQLPIRISSPPIRDTRILGGRMPCGVRFDPCLLLLQLLLLHVLCKLANNNFCEILRRSEGAPAVVPSCEERMAVFRLFQDSEKSFLVSGAIAAAAGRPMNDAEEAASRMDVESVCSNVLGQQNGQIGDSSDRSDGVIRFYEDAIYEDNIIGNGELLDGPRAAAFFSDVGTALSHFSEQLVERVTSWHCTVSTEELRVILLLLLLYSSRQYLKPTGVEEEADRRLLDRLLNPMLLACVGQLAGSFQGPHACKVIGTANLTKEHQLLQDLGLLTCTTMPRRPMTGMTGVECRLASTNDIIQCIKVAQCFSASRFSCSFTPQFNGTGTAGSRGAAQLKHSISSDGTNGFKSVDDDESIEVPATQASNGSSAHFYVSKICRAFICVTEVSRALAMITNVISSAARESNVRMGGCAEKLQSLRAASIITAGYIAEATHFVGYSDLELCSRHSTSGALIRSDIPSEMTQTKDQHEGVRFPSAEVLIQALSVLASCATRAHIHPIVAVGLLFAIRALARSHYLTAAARCLRVERLPEISATELAFSSGGSWSKAMPSPNGIVSPNREISSRFVDLDETVAEDSLEWDWRSIKIISDGSSSEDDDPFVGKCRHRCERTKRGESSAKYEVRTSKSSESFVATHNGSGAMESEYSKYPDSHTSEVIECWRYDVPDPLVSCLLCFGLRILGSHGISEVDLKIVETEHEICNAHNHLDQGDGALSHMDKNREALIRIAAAIVTKTVAVVAPDLLLPVLLRACGSLTLRRARPAVFSTLEYLLRSLRRARRNGFVDDAADAGRIKLQRLMSNDIVDPTMIRMQLYAITWLFTGAAPVRNDPVLAVRALKALMALLPLVFDSRGAGQHIPKDDSNVLPEAETEIELSIPSTTHAESLLVTLIELLEVQNGMDRIDGWGWMIVLCEALRLLIRELLDAYKGCSDSQLLINVILLRTLLSVVDQLRNGADRGASEDLSKDSTDSERYADENMAIAAIQFLGACAAEFRDESVQINFVKAVLGGAEFKPGNGTIVENPPRLWHALLPSSEPRRDTTPTLMDSFLLRPHSSPCPHSQDDSDSNGTGISQDTIQECASMRRLRVSHNRLQRTLRWLKSASGGIWMQRELQPLPFFEFDVGNLRRRLSSAYDDLLNEQIATARAVGFCCRSRRVFVQTTQLIEALEIFEQQKRPFGVIPFFGKSHRQLQSEVARLLLILCRASCASSPPPQCFDPTIGRTAVAAAIKPEIVGDEAGPEVERTVGVWCGFTHVLGRQSGSKLGFVEMARGALFKQAKKTMISTLFSASSDVLDVDLLCDTLARHVAAATNARPADSAEAALAAIDKIGAAVSMGEVSTIETLVESNPVHLSVLGYLRLVIPVLQSLLKAGTDHLRLCSLQALCVIAEQSQDMLLLMLARSCGLDPEKQGHSRLEARASTPAHLLAQMDWTYGVCDAWNSSGRCNSIMLTTMELPTADGSNCFPFALWKWLRFSKTRAVFKVTHADRDAHHCDHKDGADLNPELCAAALFRAFSCFAELALCSLIPIVLSHGENTDHGSSKLSMGHLQEGSRIWRCGYSIETRDPLTDLAVKMGGTTFRAPKELNSSAWIALRTIKFLIVPRQRIATETDADPVRDAVLRELRLDEGLCAVLLLVALLIIRSLVPPPAQSTLRLLYMRAICTPEVASHIDDTSWLSTSFDRLCTLHPNSDLLIPETHRVEHNSSKEMSFGFLIENDGKKEAIQPTDASIIISLPKAARTVESTEKHTEISDIDSDASLQRRRHPSWRGKENKSHIESTEHGEYSTPTKECLISKVLARAEAVRAELNEGKDFEICFTSILDAFADMACMESVALSVVTSLLLHDNTWFTASLVLKASHFQLCSNSNPFIRWKGLKLWLSVISVLPHLRVPNHLMCVEDNSGASLESDQNPSRGKDDKSSVCEKAYARCAVAPSCEVFLWFECLVLLLPRIGDRCHQIRKLGEEAFMAIVGRCDIGMDALRPFSAMLTSISSEALLIPPMKLECNKVTSLRASATVENEAKPFGTPDECTEMKLLLSIAECMISDERMIKRTITQLLLPLSESDGSAALLSVKCLTHLLRLTYKQTNESQLAGETLSRHVVCSLFELLHLRYRRITDKERQVSRRRQKHDVDLQSDAIKADELSGTSRSVADVVELEAQKLWLGVLQRHEREVTRCSVACIKQIAEQHFDCVFRALTGDRVVSPKVTSSRDNSLHNPEVASNDMKSDASRTLKEDTHSPSLRVLINEISGLTDAPCNRSVTWSGVCCIEGECPHRLFIESIASDKNLPTKAVSFLTDICNNLSFVRPDAEESTVSERMRSPALHQAATLLLLLFQHELHQQRHQHPTSITRMAQKHVAPLICTALLRIGCAQSEYCAEHLDPIPDGDSRLVGDRNTTRQNFIDVGLQKNNQYSEEKHKDQSRIPCKSLQIVVGEDGANSLISWSEIQEQIIRREWPFSLAVQAAVQLLITVSCVAGQEDFLRSLDKVQFLRRCLHPLSFKGAVHDAMLLFGLSNPSLLPTTISFMAAFSCRPSSSQRLVASLVLNAASESLHALSLRPSAHMTLERRDPCGIDIRNHVEPRKRDDADISESEPPFHECASWCRIVEGGFLSNLQQKVTANLRRRRTSSTDQLDGTEALVEILHSLCDALCDGAAVCFESLKPYVVKLQQSDGRSDMLCLTHHECSTARDDFDTLSTVYSSLAALTHIWVAVHRVSLIAHSNSTDVGCESLSVFGRNEVLGRVIEVFEVAFATCPTFLPLGGRRLESFPYVNKSSASAARSASEAFATCQHACAQLAVVPTCCWPSRFIRLQLRDLLYRRFVRPGCFLTLVRLSQDSERSTLFWTLRKYMQFFEDMYCSRSPNENKTRHTFSAREQESQKIEAKLTDRNEGNVLGPPETESPAEDSVETDSSEVYKDRKKTMIGCEGHVMNPFETDELMVCSLLHMGVPNVKVATAAALCFLSILPMLGLRTSGDNDGNECSIHLALRLRQLLEARGLVVCCGAPKDADKSNCACTGREHLQPPNSHNSIEGARAMYGMDDAREDVALVIKLAEPFLYSSNYRDEKVDYDYLRPLIISAKQHETLLHELIPALFQRSFPTDMEGMCSLCVSRSTSACNTTDAQGRALETKADDVVVEEHDLHCAEGRQCWQFVLRLNHLLQCCRFFFPDCCWNIAPPEHPHLADLHHHTAEQLQQRRVEWMFFGNLGNASEASKTRVYETITKRNVPGMTRDVALQAVDGAGFIRTVADFFGHADDDEVVQESNPDLIGMEPSEVDEEGEKCAPEVVAWRFMRYFMSHKPSSKPPVDVLTTDPRTVEDRIPTHGYDAVRRNCANGMQLSVSDDDDFDGTLAELRSICRLDSIRDHRKDNLHLFLGAGITSMCIIRFVETEDKNWLPRTFDASPLILMLRGLAGSCCRQLCGLVGMKAGAQRDPVTNRESEAINGSSSDIHYTELEELRAAASIALSYLYCDF